MYRRHLDSLTIAVHSPFFERRHHRPAMISAQQYRLVAAVHSGWSGTQRDLAARTGYSIGGLNDALRSLRGLGIIAVRATRGRFGRTALNIVRGVHVVNVRNVAPVVNRPSGTDGDRRQSTLANIDAALAAMRDLIEPQRASAAMRV